jgi:hypothetical protein
MTDFKNIDDNPISYDSGQFTLIDEVSSTEFYIGISNGAKDGSKAIWRIKKIWKDGTVWNVGFPNGDQSSKFIWNSRGGYTYQ